MLCRPRVYKLRVKCDSRGAGPVKPICKQHTSKRLFSIMLRVGLENGSEAHRNEKLDFAPAGFLSQCKLLLMQAYKCQGAGDSAL